MVGPDQFLVDYTHRNRQNIAMTKRHIGLGTVTVTQNTYKYVNQVLASGRVSYGPYAKKLEKRLARLHNNRYAFLTNSGTSALHVSLHALMIQGLLHKGDRVIVPAITFISCVNVLYHLGLIPLLADVDPRTFTMSPSALPKHPSRSIRAIMAVHTLGHPAAMEEISRYARTNNMVLIEDASESMLASYKGQPVGSWGIVTCFSMHPSHVITAGIGGAVLTSNTTLTKTISSLIAHGRDWHYVTLEDDDTASPSRLATIIKQRFLFHHHGYSVRISELDAALGLSQLDQWRSILKKRQTNALYLTRRLAHLAPSFQLPSVHPEIQHSFMGYPIVIHDKKIDRDQLLVFLESHGVETRYLLPLLDQPVLRNMDLLHNDYPVASFLNRRGFYIGCHQDLTRQDLDYVVDLFFRYCRR